MRIKLKLKQLLKDIFMLFSIVIILFMVFCFIFPKSPIDFVDSCQIEIHSSVDYMSFIKEVKKGNIQDITVDSSQVNTKKLGTYTVFYQYHDQSIKLKVKVVDTVAPEFTVVEQKVALNQTIDPQYLVSNIEDETQTTVSFAKKYKFKKEGKQTVEVVVSDEADNETKKSVDVEVVKDTQAPNLIVKRTTLVKGTKETLESLIKVTDNLDLKPQIDIQSEQLNINQIGSYEVKFIAKDASGNETIKKETIQVIREEDEKVVYLTFDDGPSQNTPQVLDILEKYDCKASFFIIGANKSYRKYIKIAHDQGHTIGLHTYSHEYSDVYSSVDAYFHDLEKIGEVAKEYIGYIPKYIRFPGGSSNIVSRKYSQGIMSQLTQLVEEKGYIYYDWNAENGDGYSYMDKSEMLYRATLSSENKIMILMHDAGAKKATVEILPEVIEYYQNKGYVFKAIDDSTFVPHQHVNN